LAQLYPDIETIKKLHQPPTDGELALLDFLCQELNEEYEIYFQPLINGDNPDLVIMRKGGGVIIFEVKDWNLSNYELDEKNNWMLKKDGTYIKSPIEQLKTYKDNLFDLHIEGLLEKKLKNRYYLTIIQCALYFHNEHEKTFKDFVLKDHKNKKYTNFVKFYELLGNDSLTKEKLDNYFHRTRIKYKSKLFDDHLYRSRKRYLQPPFHRLEEGIPINYTKAQELLVRSDSNSRRKIKGLAGCGKTMVLAKRAVNAHLRTKEKILILTYNLALKNYIHDRINDVRENFYWSNFYIDNYHQFFISQANNYGLKITSLSDFQDTYFFEKVKLAITPFKTILIDEAQDYRTQWLEIITKYFLNNDYEFIVFGDEKQNIYHRPLDENKEPIIKTIRGDWNKSLNASRRFTVQLGALALRFQNQFFSRKYTVDEIEVLENPELDFDQQTIVYFNLGIEVLSRDIFEKYRDIVRKYHIHPSDIGILSARVECLRELDFLIRKEQREKTKTTFETKEFYEKLKKEFSANDEGLHDKLEDIRRYKKNHFWMKTGTMKLSTIHSFKGWEIHTLFLLIENEEMMSHEFTTDELVYTGITRARVNLFIFNLGNEKYDRFFSNYSD